MVDIAWADRRALPLCRGRGDPVGPARRQPACLQLAAGMPGVRRRGGEAYPASHWDELHEPPPIRAWDESRVTDSDEEVVIQQIWGEIRRFMWNFVGIVRTTKRLERAKRRIDMLRQEVSDYYRHFRVTAGPDRAPQPARGRRPDRPLGPVAAREPRAALYARLSRAGWRSGGHGAGAIAELGQADPQ